MGREVKYLVEDFVWEKTENEGLAEGLGVICGAFTNVGLTLAETYVEKACHNKPRQSGRRFDARYLIRQRSPGEF